MANCNFDYVKAYKTRVLKTSETVRDLEVLRKKRDFERYLSTTPSAMLCQITEKDEITITEKTRKILVSITDVTKNDKRVLDEKNLYCKYEEDIYVGSYVLFGGIYWLIIFEEKQAIPAKKHFIMRKCNNFMTLKYEGEFYKIPISIENLTMYSDGIAERLPMSVMDSKKQIWYGANPATNSIREHFRVLLTHNTAFKITHINDFEVVGLIKSLVLQTVVIDGDDVENHYANNEEYYNKYYSIKNTEKNEPILNEILGEKDFVLGETKEYKFESEETNLIWSLDSTNSFELLNNLGNTVKVKATSNFKKSGSKAVLTVANNETSEILGSMNLILGR